MRYDSLLIWANSCPTSLSFLNMSPTAQRLPSVSWRWKLRTRGRLRMAFDGITAHLHPRGSQGPVSSVPYRFALHPKQLRSKTSSPCRQLYPGCCCSYGPLAPDPHVVNSCVISDHSFIRNTTSRDLEPYAAQCSKNGEPPGVHSLPDNCENLVIKICNRMMVDFLGAPYMQNKLV